MSRKTKLTYQTEGEPFPSQLRFLMDNKKPRVTQKQLAEYLGVSKSSVGFYRTGQSYPSFSNLVKIADYFGVPVDFLLGHKDNEQKTSLPDYVLEALSDLLIQDDLEQVRSALSAFLESTYIYDFLYRLHRVYEETTNLVGALEELRKPELRDSLRDQEALLSSALDRLHIESFLYERVSRCLLEDVTGCMKSEKEAKKRWDEIQRQLRPKRELNSEEILQAYFEQNKNPKAR